MTRLEPSAVGAVTARGRGASHVRLFVERGGGWERVTPATRFTAAELDRGLRLGLEGKDIVRNRGVWNGAVKLRLTVTEGGAARSDRVALRVAPLLAHTHLQRTGQIVTAPGDDPDDRRFLSRLRRRSERAGVPEPVLDLGDQGDRWAQDWFEPMYAAVPSERGAQRLRVLVRSDQDRPAQQSLLALRGRNVAVVRLGARGAGGPRSSLGNVETIPPYSHRGERFPAGRIVYGVEPDGERPSRATRKMLRAQGAQPPLAVDTGWLDRGHVDEFVQFIPAHNARGWTIAVADPLGAVRLLRQARAEGRGDADLSPHPEARQMSIGDFLADERLRQDQVAAAARIGSALRLLRRRTGVANAEVVRVPVLYTSRFADDVQRPSSRRDRGGGLLAAVPEQRGGALTGSPAGRQAALTEPDQMGALLPAAINSVVVSPRNVIVARQFGPVVGGRDLFARAARRAYARVGLRTLFLDVFTTYHRLGGEVHCATNALREMRPRWWRGTARRRIGPGA